MFIYTFTETIHNTETKETRVSAMTFYNKKDTQDIGAQLAEQEAKIAKLTEENGRLLEEIKRGEEELCLLIGHKAEGMLMADGIKTIASIYDTQIEELNSTMEALEKTNRTTSEKIADILEKVSEIENSVAGLKSSVRKSRVTSNRRKV